uniref:Reverse transcriptase Ty1/copia-type domain-containing protein n=1 Tax=Fagus sylvatica TaxID=28930 RepID=A0A2N9H6C1_FAGSY
MLGTIVEYSHEFKSVCDQLAAMGRPVDDLDKIHWYLRGLGSSFSTFSTTQLSLSSLPSFTEIVPMAESYENFVKSLELPSTGSTSAAFTASCSNKSASARGGGRASRGSRSRGGSRYQRNRPIRCQICRGEGHYATSCRDRYSHSSNIANIMEAFTSCTLNDNQDSDWYTDTGATAHMTNDATQLDKSNTYTGKDRVIVESSHKKGGGNRTATAAFTINRLPTPTLDGLSPFEASVWHAIFDELNYPFKGTPCSGPLPNCPVSAFLEPPTFPVAELPTQPNPTPRHVVSCLTDPSASFVPLSVLQAPDAEPTIPSVHEPSHASTLMPADPESCHHRILTYSLGPSSSNWHSSDANSRLNQEFSSLPTDPICAPFLTPTCSTLFSPCASPKASSPLPNIPGWIVAMDEEIQALHKKSYMGSEVYMDQPSGYVDSKYLTHVCRLRRALYGLKQAPRAWFHRFSSFLLAIGFICSRADSSLFVLSKGADLIYLLLYVDDVVVTGSNSALLDGFIGKLTREFATKDLGSLNYFLGLEAHRTSTSLFLSQAKYAHEILQRAQLLKGYYAMLKGLFGLVYLSLHLLLENSLLIQNADWAGCPEYTSVNFWLCRLFQVVI